MATDGATGGRGSRNRDHRDRPGPGLRRGLDDPAAVDRRADGGKAAPSPRRGRRPRHAAGVVLTTAFSDAVDDGADRRTRIPPCGEAFDAPDGDAPPPRRPQLVGRRGHGRRRRWPASSSRSSGSAASTRSSAAVTTVLDSRQRPAPPTQPDRGARPAADRARVRRRDVRHRPGDRSHRPPGRLRRRGRTRAAGERRGRRLAVRARRADGQGPRVRRQRRPRARPRPTSARLVGAVGTRWPRSSAARRTSSGRSPTTASCGCCSRARSPPRSGACPRGPVYGPGPVAETFPEPLTELERDLWVPPLREAVREAVLLAGAATPAEVDGQRGRRRASTATSPSTCGWPARSRPSITLLQRAQPRPGGPPPAGGLAGRPAAGGAARAWPSTSSTAPTPTSRRCPALVRADQPPADRAAAPQPGGPARAARARDPHRHAHRHRRQPHDRRVGGAAGARRGAPGRPERRGDPRSAARPCWRSPPPRVGPRPELPARGHARSISAATACQTLQRQRASCARRCGCACAGCRSCPAAPRGSSASGWPPPATSTEPELIRHMTLDHVEAVATKRAVVVPALRRLPTSTTSAPPLPASFQLSDLGKPDPGAMRHEVGGGTGAGGGVGQRAGHLRHRRSAGGLGARHDDARRRASAPLLPRLKGIVAETGSVLSPPRDPRPGGRGADGRRLRRVRPDDLPEGAVTVDSSTATPGQVDDVRGARRRRREDHRLARRHRHAARRAPST